jgi:SAM-dependent methyltransferase
MDPSLTTLPDHPDARRADAFAGPDHPMRRLTRATAFGTPWTSAESDRIQDVFDGLADGWSEEHVDPVKAAPVEDALARGDLPLRGRWLEVGSGTGAGARIVADRVDSLVCTDLSAQMLANAPDLAPRVRADASILPFPDDSFQVVMLINMILFPLEVDRVLCEGGAVLWVNTLGDQTPIHLAPHDVLSALPGDWTGRTAQAGTGLWLVARRG